MLDAMLRRLKRRVEELEQQGGSRQQILSCLEEAEHLCANLEREREDLGREIQRVQQAKNSVGLYRRAIARMNREGVIQ